LHKDFHTWHTHTRGHACYIINAQKLTLYTA
jgi:hypothetical protein